jgi:hypothetical protein
MILSDKDISNFNDKLNDKTFMLRPVYASGGRGPVIAYYAIPQNLHYNGYNSPNIPSGPNYSSSSRFGGMYDDDMSKIPEPVITFEFSFSICEKRYDDFFEIFDTVKKSYIDAYVYETPEKMSKIVFSEKSCISKRESTHKIFNRNFKMIEYTFNDKVSSVMCYLKYIEDSIEYFNLIWGYTSEGEEINLLKYNVGSIVSPIADKSVDLMIVDYVYKKYNDLYVIEYKTCQILGTDKSHIIKYGEFRVLPDTKLTISRNNNLDSLLN